MFRHTDVNEKHKQKHKHTKWKQEELKKVANNRI